MRLIDADALIEYMVNRQEMINDDEAVWETSSVRTALNSFAPTVNAIPLDTLSKIREEIRELLPYVTYDDSEEDEKRIYVCDALNSAVGVIDNYIKEFINEEG